MLLHISDIIPRIIHYVYVRVAINRRYNNGYKLFKPSRDIFQTHNSKGPPKIYLKKSDENGLRITAMTRINERRFHYCTREDYLTYYESQNNIKWIKEYRLTFISV
jgi:hypothetical protein